MISYCITRYISLFFIKFYSTTYGLYTTYTEHTVTNAIEPIFFFLERVWSILDRNIPPRYHEACKSGIGKAEREREREEWREKRRRENGFEELDEDNGG